MATEHFCLRWNNHQSTLVSVFDNLLESGTLVDCTLAADGRYLKAHKVVLSACSPYLGMLLSQHYDKHPIIILKDVKFDELKAMLDYMYRGEVNISQEQLSTFLKAAETLQIKGLTDAGSDEGNGLQPNRPPSSNSTTSANEDPPSPGPPGEGGSSPGPRKRKRNKHGDDGEGDSVSKISLSEGSDRLSATSVGSPSAGGGRSASVKREPADGEGDGQMSVDDSGEVVMMSRPGPSNGGTNNKAPWILSADSSGEEMQLTPGQDDEDVSCHLCEVCGQLLDEEEQKCLGCRSDRNKTILQGQFYKKCLPVLTPLPSFDSQLPVLTPLNVPMSTSWSPHNHKLPVLTPIANLLSPVNKMYEGNDQLPVLKKMDFTSQNFSDSMPVLTPMNNDN